MTVVVATAACMFPSDPDHSRERIGVTRNADGDMVLLFRGCADGNIESVELHESDLGHTETLGTVWVIDATDAVQTQGDFVVGESPPGFRVATPPRADLADVKSFFAVMDTGAAVGSAQSFHSDDLVEGKVLMPNGDSVEVAEFEKRAADSCNPH